MQKLTAAELREPDVTLTIPYERFKFVPPEVWKELEAYIGRDTGRAYVYTVPAYRAREFEQYGRRLTAASA